MHQTNINNLIKILGLFKDLKRSGWIKRNVLMPESDADHSFSTCFLAFLLTPQHLNRSHCIELALIHDLAEIYCGDYTPCDNLSPQEKHHLEEQGIIKISKELDMPKIIELFNEFEQQKTEESKFVKALDKLDTVLTACYYDDNKRAPTSLFDEFSSYANKRISEIKSRNINKIKIILSNIIKERNQNDQN